MMPFYKASDILLLNQMNTINIGILAHIDAGKTSITENLLFSSGATDECGSVDSGNTITDSMDIEKRRGITVRASTTSIVWDNTKINIIDTPGHMDFIAEVERTFRMLDGAILVISAKEGIQAQTKLLFDALQRLNIPTIIFINKIDRVGVNIDQLYSDINATLSQDVFVMQAITNGLLHPICTEKEMNENHKEIVLDNDDNLLEKYLADIKLTNGDYWKSIINLVKSARFCPIFHGSAMYNIGIKELLNTIVTFIKPPVIQSNELSVYVYKIEHSKKEQKRAFLKVISGSLKVRTLVEVNNSDRATKIRNLKTISLGKEIEIDEVFANDIAIVDNVEDFQIGDYLGVEPMLIEELDIPSPALQSSIFPHNAEDRSKLITAMNTLFIEDPSLSFSINQYSNELEVSLYGLTQREVILTLLDERFSLKAYFDEVKTVYKERPKRKVEQTIHIEVAPNPYWASIGLTIEPLPIGSGLLIESDISLGYLNHSFQNAVFDGIRKACESGLYGWEVTDFKVTFSYAIYYSPVSTPADFRKLAPYVLRLALQQSDVEILEPMLQFKLQVPQSANAKAIADMQKMMAEIESISSNNDWTNIEGRIPLDNSKEYSYQVSSYTQGLGTFMVKPCKYRITKKKVVNTTNIEEKDKLLFMFEKSLS